MKKLNKKNSHLRVQWSHMAIVLITLCIIGFLLFKGVTWLFHDPYTAYQTYNENTKLAGEMQHMKQKEKGAYFISYYYPTFGIKNLDAEITKYGKQQAIPLKDKKEMHYISIDYDTEEIYDNYINLVFHKKVVDENNKVLQQKDTYYNYDKKRNRFLHLEDILRRDYIAMMKTKAKAAGIKESLITKENLSTFIVGKKEVTFYIEGKKNQKISIPYKENKKYIALTNKNIPSYYMKDPIIPASQPKIEKGKKLIAFTFDDGPHYENTKEIMKEFEKYNGRATFFMLGQNTKVNPDIVKDVYKRGHEVANHSWDHSINIAAQKPFQSKKEVTEEIYKVNDSIFQITGFEPRYFRPPFGAINQTMKDVCGLDMVLWDIDSEDWRNHNADTMSSIVEKGVSYGNKVILMHDIHKDTVKGVKKLLKELDAQGYQFVTIDTLMKEEGNTLYKQNAVIQANI